MMESVGLIALGYIIAVAGAESTAVIIAGLLVMLAGWFFLIRSGHGTLHPKARQVAATRQVEEQKVMAGASNTYCYFHFHFTLRYSFHSVCMFFILYTGVSPHVMPLSHIVIFLSIIFLQKQRFSDGKVWYTGYISNDMPAGQNRPAKPNGGIRKWNKRQDLCWKAAEFYSDEINKMLALKKKLGARLQSVLGLGVNVKLVEPRSIERSVGKAKRVIDNRKL